MIRQRALQSATGHPVFGLNGGPGSSNIRGSGDYQEELFTSNDLVRVGYRGIDSDRELKCPEYSRALQNDSPLSTASILQVRDSLRKCYERFVADGVDIDGYNLSEMVEDIEAVRRAFAYEKISFWGISWGTQIAYAYAMRYPDRVHRMFLLGATSRARGFDVWDPAMIDRKLEQYNALWKADSAAVKRSPDITKTVRNVLSNLPREWEGFLINRDKVRITSWYMLRETEDAAQLFDAFVAAERGDYSGVAVLSWAYDRQVRTELHRDHGPWHGEFFAKTMSSGLDTARDYIRGMDPEGSVLGSPAAKLLYGSATRGGWPTKLIPPELRRNQLVEAEVLVVMGNLDLVCPYEYLASELMPQLPRGRLLVLSNMGHTGPARLQPDACKHLSTRFLLEGVVDSSRYSVQRINFTPTETLQDAARGIFKQQQ